MLLVVDVGNTQTHFGLFPDGGTTVSEHWRFATVRESTGDELGAALSNLLGLRGMVFHDVDTSIVSSTVPQLSEQWTLMARHYLEGRLDLDFMVTKVIGLEDVEPAFQDMQQGTVIRSVIRMTEES